MYLYKKEPQLTLIVDIFSALDCSAAATDVIEFYPFSHFSLSIFSSFQIHQCQ